MIKKWITMASRFAINRYIIWHVWSSGLCIIYFFDRSYSDNAWATCSNFMSLLNHHHPSCVKKQYLDWFLFLTLLLSLLLAKYCLPLLIWLVICVNSSLISDRHIASSLPKSWIFFSNMTTWQSTTVTV